MIKLFLTFFSPPQIYRNPAERLPTTKDADTCSEENHALSQEESCQSFNGVKKFSMSYQKTNNGNENGLNGTTHIAQLHAVPGYTCLIDEVTPSRMTKGDNPVSSIVNGACPKDNIFVGKMECNNFIKSMTDLSAGGTAGTKTSKGNVEFQNKSNRSRSNSVDKLFDACEVGNGIHYPKVRPSSSFPSNYGNNYDSSRRSMASKFRSFKTDTSEGYANDYSLPLFDEEVDTNSVAATSMAALKKAIEEAQARMKIAKESMERKKFNIQNRVKVGSDDGLKVEERKEIKIVEKANRSKNMTTCDTCEEWDVPLHISSGTGKQNAISPGQVTTDFKVKEKNLKSVKEADGEAVEEFRSIQADHRQEDKDIFEESEQFYEVAKEADEETLGKEFTSSHEKYNQEEADTFEEEDQFYEVTNTGNQWDTLLEFEDDKDAKRVMQSVDRDEWKEKKMAKEVFEQPEEGGERLKPTEGEGNPEEMEKCFKGLDTVKMASDCENHGGRLMSGAHVFDPEESDGRLKVAHLLGESDKKVQAFCEKDECQKEEKELQEPIKDEKILESLEAEDVELLERQQVVWESVENKNKEEETSKQEELEKELKDAHERMFNKDSKQDTLLERLDDFHQREEVEKILIDESHLENEEFQQVVEDEKIVAVDAYLEEENEKTFKLDVHQEEKNEEIIKVDAYQVEEIEKIFKVNVHQEDEIEEIIKVDAYQEEENGKIQEEICESVKAGGIEETKIEPSAGDGKIKVTNEDLRNQENNVEEADNLCKHDESDNLNKIQKPTVKIENMQGIEVSMEIPPCEESGSLREVTEVLLDPEENGKELELIEEDNVLVGRKILETDGLFQGFKLTKIMPMEYMIETTFLNRNGINLDITGIGFMQKQHDQQTRDFEIVCKSGKHVERSVPGLEKMNEDVKETEVSMNHSDEEKESKCFEEERWVDNGINIGEAQLYEINEVEGENVGPHQEIKTSLCTEKDHENHQETLTDESAETYIESYQETLTSLNAEKEEKHYGTLPNQGTQNHDENHQETQTSQSTETKEGNREETLTVEEGETDESLQKEVELEKKHLKKIDEAKEREREKERIAVERAIREARKRAFAEAKERAAAERAAAEARRRLMAAESRERFGKDSAEANDKSLAEKASNEAKRKAERAAVERATAEARVRALEKAMSGKAASETRKFASEKFSGGPSPSSTSSFPNSSNHVGM